MAVAREWPSPKWPGSAHKVESYSCAAKRVVSLPAPGGMGQVSDIVLDPDDWMTAYVLQGNGVFMTTDGGMNFTAITDNLGSLSTQIRSLSLWDPMSGTTDGTEIVLAGGRGGVYRLLPGSPVGATWSEYGVGMPNTITEDLQVYGNYLLAGTYGRRALSIADGARLSLSRAHSMSAETNFIPTKTTPSAWY